MAAQSKLQLVIEGVDKASGPLSKVNKSVNEMGNASETSGSNLKALGATALKVTAGLAALGLAAKKAFDLGKEGAAIKQTGQSFEFLIQKVGASANLLDQLRSAAKGTISDMDLMSSTATLLAGTQGALAQELASSTPILLEIAKAAQKLNPALGDTTFLYDSLALGVKRASPMILDNLGLTIRIGEANAKYAIELGKTVAELTSNELKQALLNETLRAGAVLIEQAGGTTESATDSYKQFEAAVDNITDSIKIQIHDAVEPLVGALAVAAQAMVTARNVVEQLDDAMEKGILTQQEAKSTAFALSQGYITTEQAVGMLEEATRRARHEGTLHVEQLDRLLVKLDGTTVVMMEQSRVSALAADAAARQTSGLYELARANEAVQISAEMVSRVLGHDLAVATGKTSREIIMMEKQVEFLSNQLDENNDLSLESRKKITALQLAIIDAKDALRDASPAVQDFSIAFRGLEDSADRAKLQIGGLIDTVVRHEEIVRDTTGTTEEWAAIEDDLALAIGRKNDRVVDAERALRKLEREVSENVRSFEDAEEAIFLAKVELHEANEEWAESNNVIKDNTAILKDNTEERERAAGISDAYAKLIGRENDATLRLRDTIEMQTEAFEELGLESGFTEEGIAALMVQLDDMRDILRDSTRDSNLFADSLGEISDGADKTKKSVAQMRTELIAAGGDWWATASAAQVAEEHASLASKAKTKKTKTKTDTTGDLLPGQTSPDVSKGDTGQWGVEYGDQEGGWNEMFGEWQPGAAGRSEEEQATDVIKDMMGRHGFNPDAPQGWAMDFLRTGGGPGSGTGLIGRGFSDDAITAALKNAGGQHGLDMIVPSGFNRDNFMVGTTSGERVTVTPSHMLGGGNGGGLTVNTINVYGVQTASSLYEEVVKAARQRGRAFAKVM